MEPLRLEKITEITKSNCPPSSGWDGFSLSRLCFAPHHPYPICTGVPPPHVPPQAALPWMRYVAVACVVGIIAGFCMGPGGSGGCKARAGGQHRAGRSKPEAQNLHCSTQLMY